MASQASPAIESMSCATCGIDLERQPRSNGRLPIAVALSVPLAVLALIPQAHFPGWEWPAMALATAVALWCGLPLHRAALHATRNLRASMDTLVSVGSLAAYLWSVVVLIGGIATTTYFEVGPVIVTLVLLGRWLEAGASRRSSAAIRALAQMGAKQAILLNDGHETLVPVERLRPGDLFVVRPGEKIATDGVVVDGCSTVDRSMLTGESMPQDAVTDDEVAGATINGSGRLVVKATKVGADTALAQIASLIAKAQEGKAPIQRLADRVSAVFVPAVIACSLVTLAGWLISGASAAHAFTAGVAVLIIACPCALGLATPTALMVATGRGAQLGVLVKGPEVLERSRAIDTILLDKTGTLTEGTMAISEVAPSARQDELLALAGAAESASEHPIGVAIAAAARSSLGKLAPAQRFQSSAGLGVQASVEGRTVLVGSPQLLATQGITLDHELSQTQERMLASGQTVVGVAIDGHIAGLIALADEIKQTSPAALAQMRSLGLQLVLLTGDHELAARRVASVLGIDRVLAGVLPSQKASEVTRLRNSGAVVAMVGDGVNDAPALASADLGLALGTGTDVAIEASDLTLLSSDLHSAVDAIALSRRTLRTIKANLFWAFAYNLAAIPVAAAGLLNPMIACAAMALSSLFVVSNSLRLRSFKSTRVGAL